MTSYPERIQLARKKLAETQHTFGKRFGVTATAVSLWEKGDRSAPYEVLSFVEDIAKNWRVCPTCEGVGWTKNETKFEMPDKPSHGGVDLEGFCHHCVAVPAEYNYDYTSKEDCRCDCHRKKSAVTDPSGPCPDEECHHEIGKHD